MGNHRFPGNRWQIYSQTLSHYLAECVLIRAFAKGSGTLNPSGTVLGVGPGPWPVRPMTLFAAGGWSWSGKLASQWLDGIDMLDLPPSDHEIPSDFGLQLGSTWYLWGPSGATWVTGVRTPRSSAPEPEGCVLRKMLRIQSLAV